MKKEIRVVRTAGEMKWGTTENARLLWITFSSKVLEREQLLFVRQRKTYMSAF